MAGETTATSGITPRNVPAMRGPGITGHAMTVAYATGELEINDVKQIGYIPAGATVVGFLVKATDMDTNGAPALVQKITVGATDLVTGITAGQSAGQAAYACTPTTVTSDTLVSVTVTTAAATAASGTLHVTALYTF